jgi:hypothetical protein
MPEKPEKHFAIYVAPYTCALSGATQSAKWTIGCWLSGVVAWSKR